MPDKSKDTQESTAVASPANDCYVASSNGKIKVSPEGRDGVWLIEKEEAMKIVHNFADEQIHNYIPCGPTMLGADWDKESVVDQICEAERVAVLTGDAQKQNMRHALSVIVKNKLYMFDVGEITENDLEIQPAT